MFDLPKRPMFPALAVSVTAVVLAASGAAIAQSSPNAEPAQAPSAAAAQPQTSSTSLALSSQLSDSVGFDIRGPENLRAEVIPGISPSFRFVAGWTDVTHVGTGHYCLNGGIAPNGLTYNYPAVVSVSHRDTTGVGYVEYASHGNDCPGVGVWTYRLS